MASGAKSGPLVAASAKLVPISPIIKPKLTSCGAITGLTDLAANPQYPTAIASSTDVPASGSNPEYCDVKGMIAPQTHFDLQLPVNSWQGRYLQNGCGGLLRDREQPDLPLVRRATRRRLCDGHRRGPCDRSRTGRRRAVGVQRPEAPQRVRLRIRAGAL